jgi:xylan 1,4-beta-xylosidase
MLQIENPILKGFNPDPALIRVGEDYYCAVSTFEWFPGVAIHHSKDLVNWRLASYPLTRKSQIDMRGNPNSGGVWAPCLTYADGRFWLIYSDVKTTESKWTDVHNYLVTCETIDGDWGEPIRMGSHGADPSLFHDTDGRKWYQSMIWDPRVGKHSFSGILLQEYDHKQKKLIGPQKNIFKGTNFRVTEAPHIYKIDDYYYLLTAEGGTKYSHAATVARSKDIWGPYEVHPENPIMTAYHEPFNYLQKCGHASFFDTPDGEWYAAHLTARPIIPENDSVYRQHGFCPLGRESAIQKMEWRDGWPYVLGGKQCSRFVDAPKNVVEHKFDSTYPETDYFTGTTLNINFSTLRIPFSDEMGSLTENPGHLRLFGKESLTSLFTQSHVARRWQSLNFEAGTAVKFNPVNFQQSAGFVNYYNTNNWTALMVTWHEDYGRIIELSIMDNGVLSQPLLKKIAVPESAEYVHFRSVVDYDTYYYSYSFDGTNWATIDMPFSTIKLSDEYVQGRGAFTGAFIGMYCGDTSGQDFPADFKYFTYKED